MGNIVESNEIKLSAPHEKMVRSGWGNDTYENSIVENITYLSDGLKIKGFVARPKDEQKEYPCIIWNRGGFGQRGALDNFTARGMLGLIASWGYVVFASQYRGNAGSEGNDEFGGDDVNDILNLIPLAEEITQADNSKWAIEGWSRGGMMTYLTLTKTDIFKAAIISGGISNLHCNAEESRFLKYLYEDSLGEFDAAEFKDKCKSRSVINFADKLTKKTPILLMHGTGDERISPMDSIEMSAKLLENKILFRLIMFEGGDHFLKTHRKEVDEARRNWLERFVKSQNANTK